MSGEKPDGAFSQILYEYDQQVRTIEQHAAAEGYATNTMITLDSYDRARHPWLHGRRLADLVAKVREVIPRVE